MEQLPKGQVDEKKAVNSTIGAKRSLGCSCRQRACGGCLSCSLPPPVLSCQYVGVEAWKYFDNTRSFLSSRRSPLIMPTCNRNRKEHLVGAVNCEFDA